MVQNGFTVNAWKYIGATVIPLALLFISVLLLVLYLNTEIRVTEKEIRGTKTIRLVHDGIIQLQKIRGLSEIAAHGKKTESQDIRALQEEFLAYFSTPQWQSYGLLFEVTDEIAKVRKDAAKLFSISPVVNPERYRFQQYTQIIADMYRIIRLVSDRSYLTQDQDLDTYYMIHLVVNQLPELIEYIGETRGIGSGIIALDINAEEEIALFREHLTASDLAFGHMDEDINIILMTVPHLEEIIKPLTNKAKMGLQHFIEESQEILIGKPYRFNAEHYFHDGTLVIDAFHDSHKKITNLIEARLEERLKSQHDLRLQTIALASLGAILIIYFINSFYRTNRSAFRTIERLSISDHLTDLYNRRYLHQIFPQELRRSRREMKSFSFGILDVDYFKAFNDIYGHPEGDIILRKIADTLKETLRRAGDFVFRIGGEEFCFLITDMEEKDVKLLLEQIRLRVMALEITHEGNESAPFVTVSVGAVYLEKVADETMDEIIRCADYALYMAKDMGRNCWHFENILTAPCDVSDEVPHTDWQI